MQREAKGARVLMDKDQESSYLLKQVAYFKQKIDEIEADLEEEDMIVFTNNTKTMMANPKIKILNDYTKNILSIYAQLMKIVDGESKEQELDELDDFIQAKNKPR